MLGTSVSSTIEESNGTVLVTGGLLVDGTGGVSLFAGERFRRIQTGVVTNYAALLALTFLVLVVVFALLGGWV